MPVGEDMGCQWEDMGCQLGHLLSVGNFDYSCEVFPQLCQLELCLGVVVMSGDIQVQ